MNNIVNCIILVIAILKIFCNISVTYIKKEMTAFEFLTRSLETMIGYLIIAVLLN